MSAQKSLFQIGQTLPSKSASTAELSFSLAQSVVSTRVSKVIEIVRQFSQATKHLL